MNIKQMATIGFHAGAIAGLTAAAALAIAGTGLNRSSASVRSLPSLDPSTVASSFGVTPIPPDRGAPGRTSSAGRR